MRIKEEGQKDTEKQKKQIEEPKKDLDKNSKRRLMVECFESSHFFVYNRFGYFFQDQSEF